jgi:hypothetical protein
MPHPVFRWCLKPTSQTRCKGEAKGFYTINPPSRAIAGTRFFNSVFNANVNFALVVDRPLIGVGLYSSLGELRDSLKSSGRLLSGVENDRGAGVAGMQFLSEPASPAHFVATLGRNGESLLNNAQSLLEARKVDAILKQKPEAYASRRPQATGLFEGAPEAIGNSMFWNTLYAPSNGLIFPSISRHWANAFGGWVVGEWDCFFGALLTALEDKSQTDAAIKALLLAQSVW